MSSPISHALLGTAAGSGPYVLVGHSVGGLFARLYASQYPDQVAGLVLVDASHELQDQRRQDLVSADLFAAEQQAVQGNSEGIDLEASFAQMSAARAATPLQPMPLVVLSAGQDDPALFPEGWPMEEEAMLHTELQQDLAGLVPDGRLRRRRAERPLHPAEPTRSGGGGDPGRSAGGARTRLVGNTDILAINLLNVSKAAYRCVWVRSGSDQVDRADGGGGEQGVDDGLAVGGNVLDGEAFGRLGIAVADGGDDALVVRERFLDAGRIFGDLRDIEDALHLVQ